MRFRPTLVALTCCLILSCFSSSIGQSVVNVALIKPWGTTLPVWTDINAQWSNYGPTQVIIDTTTFNSSVTLAQLMALDPDVLFFSDCAGGTSTFTAAEQADIQQFLSLPGKNAVSTYLTFQYNSNDNRWLCPLFGVDPSLTFIAWAMGSQVVNNLTPGHPLMAGIGTSFVTTAYYQVSVPGNDNTWDFGDYLGNIVASNSANDAVVHTFQRPTGSSVMISFMPEYGGGTADWQLVYNAMVYEGGPQAALTQQGNAIPGSAFGLSFLSPDTPLAPYAMGLSLSDSPGVLTLAGRSVPLTPDPLFWMSVDPTAGLAYQMTGTLDGIGEAPIWGVVLVPNLPGLSGFTFYAGGITFDPLSPDGIGAITPALPITIQ